MQWNNAQNATHFVRMQLVEKITTVHAMQPHVLGWVTSRNGTHGIYSSDEECTISTKCSYELYTSEFITRDKNTLCNM